MEDWGLTMSDYVLGYYCEDINIASPSYHVLSMFLCDPQCSPR